MFLVMRNIFVFFVTFFVNINIKREREKQTLSIMETKIVPKSLKHISLNE